jgi:hypothetical protein
MTSHFTDHNQPRMDTYTDGELDTFGWLQICIQVSQGSKNSQTSADSSLSIIFMR